MLQGKGCISFLLLSVWAEHRRILAVNMNHSVQVYPQWNKGGMEMKSIDAGATELKWNCLLIRLCVENSLVMGSFTTQVLECPTFPDNESGKQQVFPASGSCLTVDRHVKNKDNPVSVLHLVKFLPAWFWKAFACEKKIY